MHLRLSLAAPWQCMWASIQPQFQLSALCCLSSKCQWCSLRLARLQVCAWAALIHAPLVPHNLSLPTLIVSMPLSLSLYQSQNIHWKAEHESGNDLYYPVCTSLRQWQKQRQSYRTVVSLCSSWLLGRPRNTIPGVLCLFPWLASSDAKHADEQQISQIRDEGTATHLAPDLSVCLPSLCLCWLCCPYTASHGSPPTS